MFAFAIGDTVKIRGAFTAMTVSDRFILRGKPWYRVISKHGVWPIEVSETQLVAVGE